MHKELIKMYCMKITCLIVHEYLIMLCILSSLSIDDTQSVWPPRKNFQLTLIEKGRHTNHHLLWNDEEEDDFLVNTVVSNRLYWHYDTHLGNNSKEENTIGWIKPYQNRRNKTSRKTFPLVLIQVRQWGAWKLHPYNSVARKLLFTYPFWH